MRAGVKSGVKNVFRAKHHKNKTCVDQNLAKSLARNVWTSSDEYRGGSGESDQVCKWCSVVTTGTRPTPTKEQPITDRHTDLIRTR